MEQAAQRRISGIQVCFMGVSSWVGSGCRPHGRREDPKDADDLGFLEDVREMRILQPGGAASEDLHRYVRGRMSYFAKNMRSMLNAPAPYVTSHMRNITNRTGVTLSMSASADRIAASTSAL